MLVCFYKQRFSSLLRNQMFCLKNIPNYKSLSNISMFIDGSILSEKRKNIISIWKESKSHLFLFSTDTIIDCGENLQCCSLIFVFDPSRKGNMFPQLGKRCFRSGQISPSVTIIQSLPKNTCQDHLFKRQTISRQNEIISFTSRLDASLKNLPLPTSETNLTNKYA